MPLFEYRCEDCKRKFTLLVGMTAEGASQACPRCGSAQIRKLISRFTLARSEDDVLDSLSDPMNIGDPDDPKAMADWMKRVGREMGEDLGDDFDQMVEEAAAEEAGGGEDAGDFAGGDAGVGDL